MEATLQKSKSKKHRTKSKQSRTVELSVVKDNCFDHSLKNEEEISSDVDSKKCEHSPGIELSILNDNCCDNDVKSQDEISLECNSKEIFNVSDSKIETPFAETKEFSTNLKERAEKECIEKNLDQVFSSDKQKTSMVSENVSLKFPQNGTKVHSLHMYPDLKQLQQCEKMHNILSSQTLVKTSAEKFKNKTAVEANKCFQDFVKVLEDLDKHPLMDMVQEYQREKKSSANLRSRLKYLKSDLKRKKNSLWKSVTKQVSAKGKCEDGYNVSVKHSFTIKELDQEKFDDVINILKEIEELLLSDAFHSYSEEVMKLRIDHYTYEIIEKEKNKEFDERFSERDSASLKKCISVLFHSQRQNVQDRHYLNTCQSWLKTLASELIKNASFEDSLFVINHIIRCPNGIADWASELIQVPINVFFCETENSELIDSVCAQQILLALYLVLNPVPLKEFFLKNIKDATSTDTPDTKFIVLDSEGEEEESFEISKKFSDGDILSLLNQIPIRSLYKKFLLDTVDDAGKLTIKMQPEGAVLKLFAYSTAIIDVLFSGFATYYSENFELLFETISNLIRHILLYISKYWTHYVGTNNSFQSEIQAVYDKLFFHVVFKAYNFEKLHIWRILTALPFDNVSEKMLWNIMWIFFSPGRSEEQIYSEKDVEIKIKDESVENMLINHIKNLPAQDIYQLLNAIEKIIKSSNLNDKDFIKFSFYVIFRITVLDSHLSTLLSNEGLIILKDIAEYFPCLVSELIKKIDVNSDSVAKLCITLFKQINLLNWIPEETDIPILSKWLMSSLNDEKHHLACLVLKKMNWDYNEEGALFLSPDLHKQIASVITEAYVKFDANNSNEGLVSKGVKQVLQFTSMGSQREEEFVNWAWNVLFCLKLHPLDKKNPPWIEVYDGYVECNKSDFNNDFFQPVISAYENKHPAGCYLMLITSNEGHSMKGLLHGGLECFSALIMSEQYMAAIKTLYYILPFFVKNSDELLERIGFIKTLRCLITADLSVISNITREPVIGAVLHKVAAIIKHQIYQATEHTVECASPLLKLWIKILMKILSLSDSSSTNILRSSAKQVHFLLDVCVKISFLHDYTRESTLDLLNSYCNPLILPKAPPSSIWNRLFYSNSSAYAILNRNTIPEYPWLAWYVLFSEMKQKNVEDLWMKVSNEIMKNADGSTVACLKKVSQKVDLEFLPIYRWARQAAETPVSHPICPLIWQQFFLYFFHRVPVPNSEKHASVGLKFFKNSEFGALLKKLKVQLSDTESFYRNLRKKFESEDIKVSEGSNNDEEKSLFYLNLEKLFQAFKLWIDNESLHNSELCLSALEPKYCTYRLKLILNGDKRIWFDMVSNSLLKEDINQKIHSWHFSKKISKEIVESHSKDKESLIQLITRHVDRYETILPAANSKPVSVITLGASDVAFTSKDAILQLIEQNQSIIFDKAKYFCEQMRKLKQLNFNFINWTPQEYEIEDCQVTESRLCYKGTTLNGCSGAAYFKLQVQNCKRNERISERLEINRADYLIIEDQLSKLPLKDLCISSLHIENCIRSLANKIKEGKGNDGELKKMGIALFYHQIDTIDKIVASVADYPPSRQFFSSIIESLGREFLDGEDTELVQLAMSILNHPESGALALPLFNPNKSSIHNFLNVYKTLTSSVEKYSSSILIALFSKIDFYKWLNEYAPSLDARKELFKNICQALYLCGYSPSSELLPLFDILRRHFRIILNYMFPDLFLTAVSFLLQGIENGHLCTEIYYEAFHCFGCPLFDDKSSVDDIQFALKKFAQNQQLPADQKIFVSVAQLNLQQISFVCLTFYDHFNKKRTSVDLYKRYAAYIKPIGIFLAIVSHSLIALHVEDISSVNMPLCISELWDTFHHPFWPWLHPVVNNSGLCFPWTDQENNQALYMFQIFVSSLKYFHELALSVGSESSVMSYMWSCYVEIYVTPGYRHYSLSLCHTEFLNLPWHEFHPSTQDIEGMCKVLQSNLYESKEFLSKVSLKIPWANVLQDLSLTKSPDYVGKVLATLGKLLIISQLNCSESESSLDVNVFKEMESLSWHYVSIEDIEILLDLFYSKIDPFLLVSNWNTGSEFHILQFLKLICCMLPTHGGADEYLNLKRILYIKKFISVLTTCCSSKEKQILKLLHNFNDIISSLFDEIKSIICNVAIPNEQINYTLPLVKEVIILLNDLPEGELDQVALNSLTAWLSMNKKSPLLLPCLKVSCQNLNSVSHIVPLVECCISTRFRDESLDVHETRNLWHLISSYFSIGSNIYEELVTKCVEKNAFLTLYCCILHRLPQSNSTENKKLLFEQVFKWIKESQLSSESEAKFILLWDKLLDLSFKLISEQEYQVVKYVLTQFCWTLEDVAQDRSNSGFFGIIGFGQTSSLSVNFRFLSRVMMAFIHHQVPVNNPIRIEPTDMYSLDSNSTSANSCTKQSSMPTPVSPASKALDSLKALQQKKLYSALQSQIDYAAKCVSDPQYTLLQSREFLKYFALILYPKDSYLSALDS